MRVVTPATIFRMCSRDKTTVFIKMTMDDYAAMTLEDELSLADLIKSSAELLDHALLQFDFDTIESARAFMAKLTRWADRLYACLYVDGRLVQEL